MWEGELDELGGGPSSDERWDDEVDLEATALADSQEYCSTGQLLMPYNQALEARIPTPIGPNICI